MNTSSVEYLGNLRTKATHLKSGNTILTDAPTDNQGKGEAFSPTDLAATSLASCLITIMGIAAQTHEIDMTGTKATVQKIMDSNPRRIAEIVIHIEMPKKTYSEKEKAILEKAAHHCPVAMSLHDNTKESITFHWTK